jgi:gamma-glutamylcyclotransferase (GGCT)/AIG2-like uncharacterized protein YtfP
MAETRVRLFVYGTLRAARVQRALFGRTVAGAPDGLCGYRLATVRIADPAARATSRLAEHRILDPTGDPRDRLDGLVLELSRRELTAADGYEDAAYKRVAVRLESGIEAFVYVRAGERE